MATGVKPRDEDCQLTRTDLEAIQDAMKTQKFRDLLAEYCEEIRDPANQALYQQEMTQLEKERGYDVTFINPKGGYVIKTSVAGDRKAFINICSNDKVGKPSCDIKIVDGRKGMNWQIPYSLIPPREDFDHKRERCVVYDVVYHPDTLRMAEQNKQFRQLVNNTAIDALQKTYGIHLDGNNFRFPRSNYKGVITPAVIRKEDPNYKPPTDEDTEDLPPEMIEKLYPQRTYNQPPSQQEAPPTAASKELSEQRQQKQTPKRTRNEKTEFVHLSKQGYTIPKYIIKQQKNIDLQDYTYHKESKQHSAIPSQIVVEINLPLLSSTKDCILDVQERNLTLTSEKPAKYKLELTLPYAVNEQCGNAKFDKSKHKLIVSLPVIRNNFASDHSNSLKVDSGVESEDNSGTQSEEEREPLVVELSSTPADNNPVALGLEEHELKKEFFFDTTLAYILPPYTHNVMDDTVAFTFHVKNTEPDSVKVKQEDKKLFIKFTSVGAGFVPVHYAAIIAFEDNVQCENVSGEAWDNNVIMQLNVAGQVPQKFKIGLSEDNMTSEQFEVSAIKNVEVDSDEVPAEEETPPVVEVTNLGTETNIVVSSHDTESSDDTAYSANEKEIVWADSTQSDSGAKSILRKRFSRSYSESSVGDVASSMDYVSSDCIPEESSLKKTVRFSNVIARQFYRWVKDILVAILVLVKKILNLA